MLSDTYSKDDIQNCLLASVISAIDIMRRTTFNPDLLSGILIVSRAQARFYGISWDVFVDEIPEELRLLLETVL